MPLGEQDGQLSNLETISDTWLKIWPLMGVSRRKPVTRLVDMVDEEHDGLWSMVTVMMLSVSRESH